MIKDSELEKMTSKQLSELKQRVDRMIDSQADSQRSELRDRFKEMAEGAGFSLGEIVGIPRVGKGRPTSSKAKGPAAYVNPKDSSQTWSGRGRMPNWLSERVKSGAKAADFKVL